LDRRLSLRTFAKSLANMTTAATLGKHSEKSHPIQVFHRHSAEPQIVTQSQAPEFVIPLLFEMCVWRSPDRKTG
jgi:hypothetical protein